MKGCQQVKIGGHYETSLREKKKKKKHPLSCETSFISTINASD